MVEKYIHEPKGGPKEGWKINFGNTAISFGSMLFEHQNGQA